LIYRFLLRGPAPRGYNGENDIWLVD